MTTKPPHPGRLRIHDPEGGVRDLDASSLPDGLIYAPIDGALVPVTDIYEKAAGRMISWTAFAADGRALRTGTAVKKSK